MPVDDSSVSQVADVAKHDYGLRQGILPQWGTLAQSLSSIAPTASPAMVIPLVIAASGVSSWLVYLLATVGVALVAIHINVFAKSSASPGSLYAYVHEELGFWPGLVAGWALLVAYVGTASAVTGGIVQYAQGLFGAWLGHATGAALLIVASIAVATALAYRNVELSTRFMLIFEALSISLILLLFFYPSASHRLAWDSSQFGAAAFHLAPIRTGLILATFSFVGFESAAALGSEAHEPLKTIPRAILGTAILSGVLFIFSAYAEVAAFGGHFDLIANSAAPLQLLAQLKGAGWLTPLLSIGAIVSFFACTLACITAAARTALLMGAHGELPVHLSRAHAVNRTPHIAVLASGVAALLPAVGLILARVNAFDLYGWLGTIATFGFVIIYLLVVVAALVRLQRTQQLSVIRFLAGAVTIAFLIWAFAGSLNLDARGPEHRLPGIFMSVIALGVAFGLLSRKSPDQIPVSSRE